MTSIKGLFVAIVFGLGLWPVVALCVPILVPTKTYLPGWGVGFMGAFFASMMLFDITTGHRALAVGSEKAIWARVKAYAVCLGVLLLVGCAAGQLSGALVPFLGAWAPILGPLVVVVGFVVIVPMVLNHGHEKWLYESARGFEEKRPSKRVSVERRSAGKNREE